MFSFSVGTETSIAPEIAGQESQGFDGKDRQFHLRRSHQIQSVFLYKGFTGLLFTV